MARRALARVNLAAIERNCGRLRAELGRETSLCVVVKADGYGHGAVQSAQAARAGGATWLAVAGAQEAVELRRGDLDGPILIMGALDDEELDLAIEAGADVVAWREAFVARLARRAADAGIADRPRKPIGVHVKLDTGMGRLGTRDPLEATAVLDAVARAPGLEAVGAMTHFATADELDDPFFGEQLALFEAWAAAVRERHPRLLLHAANSAATLRDVGAHFDMTRCGIAVYGLDPLNSDPLARGLEPALELHSWVADVKPCAAGQSAGYGRRFIAQRDTWLGVLPIGYGDGWRRGLTNNADVLVGGRRYPQVGTVSMDNVTIDLGPDPSVRPGQRAVLIGPDGSDRITAEEVAQRLATINYEVTSGLLARVARRYHRDGEPA